MRVDVIASRDGIIMVRTAIERRKAKTLARSNSSSVSQNAEWDHG
jgi:hypothetical protein